VTDSWKITLPCSREEGEQIDTEALLDSFFVSAPTIVTREISENRPDDWTIEVYCETKPSRKIVQLVAQLSPSAATQKIEPRLEKIVDQDWLSLSQSGLEPLLAGRFHVHTSNHPPHPAPDIHNIRIDAGRAFGTGHHDTTAGCLEMLDRLKESGQYFRNIIDVGTGTGLLAFAAHRLWNGAYITASDVDKVSVEVSQQNAALNHVKQGIGPGQVNLLVSNGLDNFRVKRRAPYDLIIANILAGPLIALAPQIGGASRKGTIIILAGLLPHQQDAVVAAFARTGFRLLHRTQESEWPCLLLRKVGGGRENWKMRALKSPLPDDFFGEW